MSKKLTRHGNSLALIIDKPLLRLLKISEKTNLEILVENDALVIRPVKRRGKYSNAEIKQIARKIIDKYAEDFQKLAE